MKSGREKAECRRRGESERRLHSRHCFLPVAPLCAHSNPLKCPFNSFPLEFEIGRSELGVRRFPPLVAFALAQASARRLLCRTLCDSIFAKPSPGSPPRL